MRHIVYLSTISLLLVGCKDVKRQKVQNTASEKSYNEALILANRGLVSKDIEAIKNYADSTEWELQVTENGLFYEITKQGKGKKIQQGDIVSLNYKLSLLDGKVCYSSDSLGLKVFEVGTNEVERGLDNGIHMLSEGAIARFILPPHLGYGLLGDMNKIPPRAVLVYEIEVKKVEKYEITM